MSSTEHDHLPVVIRGEREEDLTAIRDVNLLAFRGEAEAKLVEALRRTPEFIPALSLVALHDGHVVGHILFSRIAIVSDAASVPALALAPMAVRPEYQGHGIGSKLVLQGLEECRRSGEGIVVVLGHADYYPRFGFVPARPRGILPPYEVGERYFMLRELIPGALDGVTGIVRYPPAFDGG